jgi:hypothetical protein
MSRVSNAEGRVKTLTCTICGKTFDSQQTLAFVTGQTIMIDGGYTAQ